MAEPSTYVAAGGAGASGLYGAASISPGMATVGGLVGGGMAAGAVITAAAPVAVLGLAAYGIAKLWEDW